MAKPVTKLEDLDVYNVALDFAVVTHDLARLLPASERFGLTQQLTKASVSVASNIAEGYGIQRTGGYIHHLRIARGSNREARTQLEIAIRKGYVSREHQPVARALNLSDRINQMLTVLISKLDR